jgi:Z1 domain
MTVKFDIANFLVSAQPANQYERQLKRLEANSKELDCIKKAVDRATENLGKNVRSFVIYGEPQSGKTEMMICLTAKLLDDGHKLIVHLLNDSLDLLGQNLGRFKSSGLSPAARNFSEVLNPDFRIRDQPNVVFCKKNGKDLRKFIDKIGSVEDVIVVDDEADYASPNARINRGSRTPINDLITQILGETGIYIGVTATPARLDLNNTFDNDNELWVAFPPHSKYTGQDVFFPLNPKAKVRYLRKLLPDRGADPKYAREALFSFLVNVAYQNLCENDVEENYSFLVHTSGQKADHKSDWKTINAALDVLKDPKSSRFEDYVKFIWELAASRYASKRANPITKYIIENIARNSVIVLNSERDWKDNSTAATKPTSLFTVIIGGNIVSRGVTLDNLLSMFFTRDVKHKIQQDTYIQRARMFGSRNDYLARFELTMPMALYLDWHRCFVYHRLALDAIKEGRGSLVWLSDQRISAVASTSIDRSTVDLDRGEMSFPIFRYAKEIDNIVGDRCSNVDKIGRLAGLIGDSGFPRYLRQYIAETMPNGDASVAVHKSSDMSGYRDDADTDKESITRKKGFFGKSQMEATRYPKAVHHLKVFHNGRGGARLFYKFVGSIQFIKNTK